MKDAETNAQPFLAPWFVAELKARAALSEQELAQCIAAGLAQMKGDMRREIAQGLDTLARAISTCKQKIAAGESIPDSCVLLTEHIAKWAQDFHHLSFRAERLDKAAS